MTDRNTAVLLIRMSRSDDGLGGGCYADHLAESRVTFKQLLK